MKITRLDKDHYVVGAVVITRTTDGWAAIPPDHPSDPGPDRPLFSRPTLDEALDMCAGAIEMFRPA